jgi:hypothetical protein
MNGALTCMRMFCTPRKVFVTCAKNGPNGQNCAICEQWLSSDNMYGCKKGRTLGAF